MVEIVYTDEFGEWWDELTADQQDDVAAVVGLLEARGVVLGYPHSSAVKGSKFAVRELRVQSGGRPLRVFYAFDARRQAVLLVGGDKTGGERFYEEMTSRADGILERYLAEEAAKEREK